jgi:hypothetical protein
MKKRIAFLCGLFAAVIAQAQEPYTADFLYIHSGFETELMNIVEMRDDILMANIRNENSNNYGDYFIKFSKQGAVVYDSTFIQSNEVYTEVNTQNFMERDPEGDGYFFAKVIHKDISTPGMGLTWLHMRRFDEDLNFQSFADGVTVLLENENVGRVKRLMLEDNSNVLLMYMLIGDPVIARVGLDGTLREKVSFPNLFQGDERLPYGLELFNESPRQYAFFDWDVSENDTCLRFHVVDSLFNLMDTIRISNDLSYSVRLVHNIDVMTQEGPTAPAILSLDSTTWLMAAQYKRTNGPLNGTCIVKFDKATQESLGNVLFQSQPVYTAPNKMAYPIGLCHSEDGGIYFAYRTCRCTKLLMPPMPYQGQISVVKLDKDLNIVWQRFCLTASQHSEIKCRMKTFDGGLVVGGYIYMYNEDLGYTFLYTFNDNGTVGTREMEDFVRPYAFWPNPVSDALHLEYSPDVTPAQIELYDLQGRLVRMQSKGLESVDMHGLTAGQYRMKVTMKDGKVYSDKVVKE